MMWNDNDTAIVIGMGICLLMLLLPNSNDKKPENEQQQQEPIRSPEIERFQNELEYREWLTAIPFRKRKAENWESLVPYTNLARGILSFCQPIFQAEGIRHLPSLEIKYYKHKKFLGLYQDNFNNIVVYLKGHENIPSITDTILHEIRHSIQIKRMSSEYKKYDRYTQELGYYDNPLEKDARKFASEQLEACLSYLEKNSLIRYKTENHGYFDRASARCYYKIFGRNIRSNSIQTIDTGRQKKKRAA